MMYLRFITCLSVGLFGVSLVMMTVYDALFMDWDVVHDLKRWGAKVARRHRTRYVMMDEERIRGSKIAQAYAPSRTSLTTVVARSSITQDGNLRLHSDSDLAVQ